MAVGEKLLQFDDFVWDTSLNELGCLTCSYSCSPQFTFTDFNTVNVCFLNAYRLQLCDHSCVTLVKLSMEHHNKVNAGWTSQ